MKKESRTGRRPHQADSPPVQRHLPLVDLLVDTRATLTVEDDRQDYGEERFITIGFLDGTMVVRTWSWTAWTSRGISRPSSGMISIVFSSTRFIHGREAGRL